MPPLGFHGPSGIGKTALLDQVQAEIIARGGVVAPLSGHSPQTALSTLAAAHDRLTGTDQSAADVPAGDVAAVFVAAAQTAANDDRVFMVLVDDMHAGVGPDRGPRCGLRRRVGPRRRRRADRGGRARPRPARPHAPRHPVP